MDKDKEIKKNGQKQMYKHNCKDTIVKRQMYKDKWIETNA